MRNRLLFWFPLFAVILTGCPEIERTVSINRAFSNDLEESLIASAEAICPDRQAVLDAFGVVDVPPEDECLWWHDTFDGVRIPYAVTGDAIAYYTATFAELRDQTRRNGAPAWPSLTLEYRAGVSMVEEITTETATYQDVYVVDLELHWAAICGGLCAHEFVKERMVIFDPAGDVLEVLGDGRTDLAVS